MANTTIHARPAGDALVTDADGQAAVDAADPVPEQCTRCLWYVIPHAPGWHCAKRREPPVGPCEEANGVE